MLKRISLYLVAALSISAVSGQTKPLSGPETVLPLSVLRDIINEVTGDLALPCPVALEGVENSTNLLEKMGFAKIEKR